MSRMRTLLVVFTLVCPALPASAATVGLGSGDSDPQLITDPAWQALTEDNCVWYAALATPSPGVTGYHCALYDGTVVPEGIFSIDFRLRDDEGELIPFPDNITVDPLSALLFLFESPLFDDGFTFRLSVFDPDLGEVIPPPDPLLCVTCVFFSGDNGLAPNARQVSIVAVNGVASVPEPLTLLMVGPAVALALSRRRAISKSTRTSRRCA
jgi:hypothetical protein